MEKHFSVHAKQHKNVQRSQMTVAADWGVGDLELMSFLGEKRCPKAGHWGACVWFSISIIPRMHYLYLVTLESVICNDANIYQSLDSPFFICSLVSPTGRIYTQCSLAVREKSFAWVSKLGLRVSPNDFYSFSSQESTAEKHTYHLLITLYVFLHHNFCKLLWYVAVLGSQQVKIVL